MNNIRISGTVTYQNDVVTINIDKFVSRAMIVWGIDNKLDITKEPYTYKVWFSNLSDSNEVQCEIIIFNNNGQHWESTYSGIHLKRLFNECLNSIIPYGSMDNPHIISMDKIINEYYLWPA